MKEIELKELRKKREKHFLQKNGNIIAKIYDDDVHFLKNGKYEEIDNNIIRKNDYYINKNNDYRVYFGVNNYIMRMEKDNYFINVILENSNRFTVKQENNSICYENILNDVDIKYIVQSNKVKEDIILKNKNSNIYKISFIVDTNLELYIIDKKINAVKNNETIFVLEAPFMYDSSNKTNNSVCYDLKRANNFYQLDIILDKNWLERATYPITIDPTITKYNETNSVYDTYIYPGDTNVDRNSQDILKAGVERIDGIDRVNRTLLKFDLPEIGTGSQIINAELRLMGYPYLGETLESDIINVHSIICDWNEMDANWDSMNDKYNPRIEGSFYSARSIKAEDNSITPRVCAEDITNLVKKWYSNMENFGIMLKMNEEEYRNEITPSFFSKNNSATNYNPKPILEITYRNQTGLEDYMDYKSQNFNRGKSYVNTYNGNLTAVFNVGSTISGKFPAILDLIYNTNDVVLETNFGDGVGYKFNYNQIIKELSIDGTKYLEYVDSDGTIHYFYEENNIYKDEDNLNMTITKIGNEFILRNKNDNQKKFIIINKIGYLNEIKDLKNNIIQILYDSNNKITKIIDADLKEINILRETNKTKIISPDQTIELIYANNKLIAIEAVTGVTTITYNQNNVISSIIDEKKLKIGYEYYAQKPYRVKKVLEYGLNDSAGKYFDLQYNFNSTTIVDNKNRANTLTYNNFGNLASVTTLKSKEDIKDAYGKRKIYGSSYITAEGEYSPLKNKLLNSEVFNKCIKNYLFNTNFAGDDMVFTPSAENILYFSENDGKFGSRCLALVTKDYNQFITKTVAVPKGNYYTFSCYLNNSILLWLSLSYVDSNGLDVSKTIEVDGFNFDYKRQEVTIFYPEDAQSDLKIMIVAYDIGISFIDAIQLEEGEVANNYNYISNSDFSNGLDGWTLSAKINGTDELVEVDDKFEVVTLSNGLKALKVKMFPQYVTEFSKTFNVSGKQGDIYTIAFWYKHEGFKSPDYSQVARHNNVIIRFNYIDQSYGHCISPNCSFNPNENEWQYFSADFVAEKDFDSLDLSFSQGFNANNFYITNLSLVKDSGSVSFTYDESGNIVGYKSLENELNEFNYDKNNQLTKMTNPRGKNFTFEYDKNIADRMINGISATGISNQIKYDENGNPYVTKTANYGKNEEIITGYYKIKAKGTNKYIKDNYDVLVLKETNCNHHLWLLEKVNDDYRIKHSMLNKYINVSHNRLVISDDYALFCLIKNECNSFCIKEKETGNYVKNTNDILEIVEFVDDDNSFEFYFENNNKLFLENSAEYTSDGRFIKSTMDTLLHKTEYDIDELTGLTKSVTNPKNQVTNYEYNDKGQLIRVINGDKCISYIYNNNNMLEKVVENNRIYKFDYDDFLNIKQIKIGDNINLVTNNYVANNGNLSNVTYGNNDNINFEYDQFDRLSKVIKMNDIYNYKYDNNGNIVKIMSNADICKYFYDYAKRINEYRFNDFRVTYTYDGNNNVISKTYRLNGKNINVWNGNNASRMAINYIEQSNEFNDDDSIVKTTIGNNAFNYYYDYLGRLISRNINDNYNTNYEYVTNGKRTSLLLKSIKNNNNLYSYRYDKLNNITHIYYNNNLISRYYYDEYNELKKEHDYLNEKTIEYQYDNYGNIVSKKVYTLNTNNLLSENIYEYNNSNWVDQLTRFNDENITYDEIGNPLTIGSKTLNWINGRELSGYSDLNVNANYKYNNDGIRISKTVNNEETKYYVEGKKIILEIKANNIVYYMYNDVDDIIGFKYNDDVYYYVKNAQNDIIGILDNNYNEIVNYNYDSWGNIITITDNNGIDISNDLNNIGNINPFRYKSYYYDVETKLYYLNSRYYNPVWGRFLNADGMVTQSRQLLGMNLYLYALNNPINYLDTGGNFSLKKFKKAIGKVLKTGVRIIINGLATIASNLGLEYSGILLSKSLQDKPETKIYSTSSGIADKIINSSFVQNKIQETIKDKPNSYIDDDVSDVQFDFSDLDLGLSLHNVSMNISGQLYDGSGRLRITIEDKYDFAYWNYSDWKLTRYPIVFVNNVAWMLQEFGVINEYDIIIQIDYCANCYQP